MNGSHGKVDTLGLDYFGRMTASISHEIKNGLAIINENAGLLGDLVALTDKGRPLDPARLETIAENIRRRVQHADDIVRRLNQFAHSVSGPVTTVTLREIVESTVALAHRIAAMKGIAFTFSQDDTIKVETIPFILQNMVWICLKNIFQRHDSDTNLTLDFAFQEIETDVVIVMNFSHEIDTAATKAAISEEGKPIILFLKAQIYNDQTNRTIQLRMPKKFID